MTLSRVLITAVVVENRSVADVAASYGVSRSWLYELLARYRREGEAAFWPRSRRPHTSTTALAAEVVDLIVELREKLTATGVDAGPDTIGWHLKHHHGMTVSRATVARYLAKPVVGEIRLPALVGLVGGKPDVGRFWSLARLRGDQPALTRPDGRPGPDTEIITWLDDHSRYALHVSAHVRITGPIVLASFGNTAAQHGYPASTLTDNGMVYTVRFAGL